MKQRVYWQEWELEVMPHLYPHVPTAELASAFRRPVDQVYRCAQRLGLSKSPAYLASPLACRLRRGDEVGKAHRFPKGHAPANKGQKMPRGWAPGRMATTQFKPKNRTGQAAHNWVPLASTRFSKEGYLLRKVAETGYPPTDWQPVHRLLWIEAHGPIPAGHKLIFKDGDKTHIELVNLTLISNADNMRRNSLHTRLPPDARQVVQLRASLNRMINHRSKKLK